METLDQVPFEMAWQLFLSKPANANCPVTLKFKNETGQVESANVVFMGMNKHSDGFDFNFGPQGVRTFTLDEIEDVKPSVG